MATSSISTSGSSATHSEQIRRARRWATLHTQLFPYFDGHSAQAEATGLPLIRSLALHYPEDAASWTLADEYLLGRSLLVAPVHVEGATSRVVHLPPGEWVSMDGEAEAEAPAEASAEEYAEATQSSGRRRRAAV